MSVATAAMPHAPAIPERAPAGVPASVPQAQSTPAPDHVPWHMPLAVYEKIVESGILSKYDGARHVYLWEGKLCDRMTVNRPHGLGVKHVFLALYELKIVGYDPETEVPIAFRKADSAPQPDVKVVRGRSEDYNPRMPTTADVALVVEVADSTVPKDRGLILTYAIEEIPVYWLMNIPANQMEVYSLPINGVYTSVQFLGPDDEVPVVLDGLEVGRLRVSDLLP
jgi:Putative restriction endonuclease